MQITWYGNNKVIKAFGREFAYTDESHNAVIHTEWAHDVLARPAVIFENGRDSHEVAGEVLDKAEGELIDFELFHM